MPGVPWDLRDWSIAAERQALAEFDIGLMPLPDEEWSLGKSGGKARTYMAAGVVPVVTAIGYNLELLTQKETGILITDQSTWADALEKLIEAPQARARLAQAARADVEARFSVSGQAAQIIDVLEGVLRDREH